MRRIAELDAVRGIAALAIIVFHFWLPGYSFLGTAVDLFFVLSGYLITSIILKQELSLTFLSSFYARRALRIWPIYYLTLLALVAVHLVLGPPAGLEGLPYYLTYTQNVQLYGFGRVPAFPLAFRHTWTLAIEEQFYLVWPALVCVLGRGRLVPLCAAFVATAIGARGIGLQPFLLLTHCDGLALGALLAAVVFDQERLARHRPRFRRAFGLTVVVALALLAVTKLAARGGGMPRAELVVQSFRLFLMSMVMFGIVGRIVVDAGNPTLGWLRDRRLGYLGQISYGLYLYHHVVFVLMQPFYDPFGVIKVALSFGLAIVSWEFIERPILALKDRFGYQRVAPAGGHDGRSEAAALEPAV